MNIKNRQAFIISRSACAMIKAMGMQAENKQREYQSDAMAYVEKDFIDLINEHEIGRNLVMEYLRV